MNKQIYNMCKNFPIFHFTVTGIKTDKTRPFQWDKKDDYPLLFIWTQFIS